MARPAVSGSSAWAMSRLVALGEAARLAQEPCLRVDLVEQIMAGTEEVDLVRGNEGAQRQGVVADERHSLAIGSGRGMQGEVDPGDGGVFQPQRLGPGREHLHDRVCRW